tara:strand:+ start:1044 stop:1583 length:540 start_codon:yes stop_codon:yes gene_type:complete
MGQYYNLKNIIDDFRLLVEKHKQINSFGCGDIKDLIFLTQGKQNEQAISKDVVDNTTNGAPLYPLLYVIPQMANRDGGQITYNFNVLICDIDNVKNKSIQIDLWSDTLEMAEDVVAQFTYSVNEQQGDYYDKYDVVLPVNITPFNEAYEDKLFGWNIAIQIIVDKPLNRCIAPFNNFED